MPKKRVKAKPQPRSMFATLRAHAAKLLLGAMTLGATGGGVTAYKKGDSLDVKVAKVETKVDSIQTDAADSRSHIHEHDKALNRLDRRTTRMEVQQELMLDALRVPSSKRPVKDYGPEE